MKAISMAQFGDEDVLRIKDVDDPVPGENEVRVRVRAVGVNPVEIYIRRGQYGTLPPLPYTPGNDAAGVIDQTGPGVTAVRPGDRVFVAAALAKRNTGSYAESLVCDAEAVRVLPDRISFEQGAGLGTPGLAAACALFVRARMRPGETVLIHGATGGVGLLAVQLARQLGATVIGTAGDAAGAELVRSLGAHHVFLHTEEGYMDNLVKTAGRPDVIIEMLANVNLAKDVKSLAARGRVTIVGSRGSLYFDPRDTMSGDAAILGMLVSNLRPGEFAMCMAMLTASLGNGLQIPVSLRLPLSEAARAHREISGRGKNGKIILTVP